MIMKRTINPIEEAGERKRTMKKLIAIALACATALALGGLFACSGNGSNGAAGGKVEAKASVEDYTWDELSKISKEVGAAGGEDAAIDIAKEYNLCTPDGKLDGTQVKTVTLADGTTTQVQICGFAHDGKADGSGKAGITFVFKDAVDEHSMNNSDTNSGGWEASEGRSWLNSSFKGQLPSDLQNVIVPVNKMTNNTGETTSASSVTATSDELWLFSVCELCGPIDWYNEQSLCSVLNAEGEQYKLFRDMNVDNRNGNAILAKTSRGGSCAWWERSPRPRYSVGFVSVGPDGSPGNGDNADASLAVVPGFCI